MNDRMTLVKTRPMREIGSILAKQMGQANQDSAVPILRLTSIS